MATTNGHRDVESHELGRRWTLWFDNPSSRHTNENFGETLRAIYTFATVEDFWCIQHNITPPGTLKPNCDLHLFKEGVAPKWEDPTCENGGRWTVNIPKGKNLVQDTSTSWLNSMLACIGETFDEMDAVCGVACNVRAKGNRISLWTTSSGNKEIQLSLGRQFKEVLELTGVEKISYLAHGDAKKITHSNRAADLYVI